ncbi:MAG: metallophosphoesterase [Candidatus Lokiarchaeota archaeon]|nr:metallophosphoesterase [Candidatus Lokiarchaeota archaeon]
MDKWLFPAAILLAVLAVVFPILLVVYGTLVLLVLAATAYNALRSPGPYLSLLDGGDGLRLNWLGRNNRPGTPLLAITKEATTIKRVPPDRVEPGFLNGRFTVYSAPVTGLVPGEAYGYRIETTTGRGRSRVAWGGRKSTFVFPGEGRPGLKVSTRVAALGDMQPKPIMPPILQFLIMKKLQRTRPDLLINLGDHTNSGNDARAWLWYLRLVGVVARNIPVLGTPGNHDMMEKNKATGTPGGEAYAKLVNYPGNGRYYRVRFHGIDFLSLDYQESVAPGTPQHDFVTGELASYGRGEGGRLVAFSHAAPYNTAIKPDKVPTPIAEIRAFVRPLLDGYDVLWLGGHEHAYQRFVVDGVNYVTTAATSSFHDHDYDREHMAMNVKKFHFVSIDVNDSRMSIKAIPLRGKTIDEFSVEARGRNG